MKKQQTKKYAEGGLAGIADSASAMMDDVDGLAKRINYGESGSLGKTKPVGFNAVAGFKKGGKVTRGDGVCTKGRTKGKMR